MANKKKKVAIRENKNVVSVKRDYSKILLYLQYILVAVILFVVFYPPFLRGLYFSSELYPTEILVFFAYIVFQITKLFRRDRKFLNTPLDYISAAFVVIYAISLINAASIHSAIEEFLKYCMYFAMFLMITEIAMELKKSIYIMWAIVASAVVVSLIGIDALANNIIKDSINSLMDNLNIDYTLFDTIQGTRISSTIQYANALAAYLMAVFFIILTLILLSKSIITKAIAGISGFIIMTAFLLTQSRGAYIILPIVLVVFVATLPRKTVISAAAYIFGIAANAILITMSIIWYLPEPQNNATKIWTYILAGGIITGVLIALISNIVRWLYKINWKIYAAISGAVVLIIISGSLYLFNATEPLKLVHSDTQADSTIDVSKFVSLNPNKSYILKYEVDATSGNDKPYAYTINLYSRNEKEIMSDGQTLIATTAEKGTTGIEIREVNFMTPDDVKVVRINFLNFYKGTSAVFHNAYIVDSSNGRIVKNLITKYKYLPESITNRLEGIMIDKSSIQRNYYLKDGIEIFKDNWLIGAGGGAWEKLYTGYQSFLYSSTQAHNYYLKVILETGLFGLLVLLGFGFVLILMFIRSKKYSEKNENFERAIMQSALFAGMTALLVHSAIDFDLSLSAIALLMWEMAAIFNANYMVMSSMSKDKPRIKIIQVRPVITIIITFILILFPCTFGLALKYGLMGSNAINNKDATTGLYYILKAEGLDPWMPQYKIDSVNLIYANKNATAADKKIADAMIVKADELSKYESKLLPRIGSLYLMIGNVDRGLALYDRYVELVPFASETWEQRVNTYYNVMLKYAEAGMMDKANEYISKILNISGEAKEVNTANLNPFIFTDATMDTIERTQFAKDFMKIKESINLDKVILYEAGTIDINSDNKPDGWSFTKDYAKSRKLSLLPGKKYKIDLELSDKTTLPSIQFIINGVVDKKTAVNLKNNSYSWEVTVPSTFKPDNNALVLYIADLDENDIEKLLIEED